MSRKPMLCVIGLKGSQIQAVQNACDVNIILSFVAADKVGKGFGSADEVIVMTRFVRHQCKELAQNAVGRRSVHLHRGGVSTLITRIQNICNSTAA